MKWKRPSKTVDIEIKVSKASVFLQNGPHLLPHFLIDPHTAHGQIIEFVNGLINFLGIMRQAGNLPFEREKRSLWAFARLLNTRLLLAAVIEASVTDHTAALSSRSGKFTGNFF